MTHKKQKSTDLLGGFIRMFMLEGIHEFCEGVRVVLFDDRAPSEEFVQFRHHGDVEVEFCVEAFHLVRELRLKL